MPLSHASKRVLAFGMEEADRMGHRHIGTEHLLLGLLREPTLAYRILESHGATLEGVRQEIVKSGVSADPLPLTPEEATTEREMLRSLVDALPAETLPRVRQMLEHLKTSPRHPATPQEVIAKVRQRMMERSGQAGAGFFGGGPRRNVTLSQMLADKKALTLAAAKRIAAAAEQEAIKNNWNMFIAIVDDGGNLMFLERMDDSQLGSQEVSIAKARSALLFKRPTKALEEAVTGGRVVVMSLANAVPVEGGLPLMAYGKIVGAIGISGATSPQDGIVAKAGADELEKILEGK